MDYYLVEFTLCVFSIGLCLGAMWREFYEIFIDAVREIFK